MAQPFITLSSGNSTESSSSNSINSTPFSTPSTATHDTSRASFHIKDLETFESNLQSAADRAFPNRGNRDQPRYREVSVLLLRWEDDEMSVEWEVEDLEKIFSEYGYNTEKWLIPTESPHLKLMAKALEVVEKHNGQGDLVIVYYAGHGFINPDRKSTWCCKADPSYASLEWSAVQSLFEQANIDVLLLLDCCAAASAAPTAGSAVTETIAACGFENIAPQPGRHSFTNALIEVLQDWIDDGPFSAAQLHTQLLSTLKHEKPEICHRSKRIKRECRRTPIHIYAAADLKQPSIELGKRSTTNSKNDPSLAHLKGSSSMGENPVQIESSSFIATNAIRDFVVQKSGNDYKLPRVIISLSLEIDQNLDSRACEKWLSTCPALVNNARVEAVYNGLSVLVILSLPVTIWNLLEDDPACSFVGYATSTNLVTGGFGLENLPLFLTTNNMYDSGDASTDLRIQRYKSWKRRMASDNATANTGESSIYSNYSSDVWQSDYNGELSSWSNNTSLSSMSRMTTQEGFTVKTNAVDSDEFPSTTPRPKKRKQYHIIEET